MGPAIIQRNADAAMRILGKSMFPLEKQPSVLSQLNRSPRRPVMADCANAAVRILKSDQVAGTQAVRFHQIRQTEIRPGSARLGQVPDDGMRDSRQWQ
ncbi:MAG: hypothetical protein ACI4NW_01455 [Stenotrophomonas sp.]